MDRFEKISKTVNELEVRLSVLEKELSDCINRKKQLREDIAGIEKASEWIREVANATISQVTDVVENIVTNAVTLIDDEFKLSLDFVSRRNNMECDIYLENTKYDYKAHPIDAVGGGMADIVSFGLRTVFWRFSEDIRNTMVLDEPFKFVSLDMNDDDLLKAINTELGIQIIAVTHKSKFMDIANGEDKVFLVTKENGISKISC